MSEKIVGNQYRFNGPGYLDSKIQPVEHVEDLDKILLRQRFIGLTVTVIHPDGENSSPADYWLVQNPEKEKGVLMWERKIAPVTEISIDTRTPEYINVERDGETYHVDASGDFIGEIDSIKSGITEANERISDVDEKLDREVSSLTQTITSEVDRIDRKDSEQDERLNEISGWHIEKLSEESGLTQYALVDSSGTPIGDVIDIVDEQYLESVVYIPAATEEDAEIDPTVIIGDPYLKFTWKYGIITYVAVKDWINDYFAGNGINITPGHEISVKIADVEEGNQNYLSADENGLRMNMYIDIDE